MSKLKWLLFIILISIVAISVYLFIDFKNDKAKVEEKPTDEKIIKKKIIDPPKENLEETDLKSVPTFNVVNERANNIVNKPDNSLLLLKQKVKDELKKYADDKNIWDIYKDKLDEILNNAFTDIDKANNQSTIDEVLNTGKENIDKLKELEQLDILKEKTILELKKYYKSLNFLDENELNSDSKRILNEEIEKINNRITNNEVLEQFDSSKNILQQLKMLKDIELLKEYKDNLNFNMDFILRANTIVDEGIEKIINQLSDALNIYKNKLDELKKEQDLEEYKNIKIEDLNTEKNNLNFSNNYISRAVNIVNNGIEAIKNSLSTSIIDEEYNNYIELLKKLKDEENYQNLSKFNISFGTYEENKYTPNYKEVCVVFVGCTKVEIPSWTKVTYPKAIIKGINTKIWNFIPDLDIVSVKYDNKEIYNDYYLWKNSDLDENKDITNIKFITIKYMILGDGLFAGIYEAKYEILKDQENNRYTILKSNIKL